MNDTVETQIPDMVDQAVETHEKTPQTSFAELRKKADELERQLWQEKKEREIERNMQLQAQQRQQSAQQPEDDFDFRQLEQEEFPDGKKLVKAFGTMNKKLSSYEQKLQEKDQQLQALNVAIEFPDFKNIVTAENIEKYIKNDEDMREAVEKSANPLRKAYNLIKKSASYQADQAASVAKTKPISQEQRRVDEKENKPKVGAHGVRSDAVSTAAQMSNSKMSKEQKNAIWAETVAAARK